VLGPWLDLGFNNFYSTSKPLNDFSDLTGLKIRASGGGGQVIRIRYFGGIPNVTAWPEVPLSLSQGNFDALISSDESIVSAKLWDSGVRFAFEDHQYLADYIPLVSKGFFDKLPPDLQKLMVELWARKIPGYRQDMADLQLKARGVLEEHGVKFTDLTPTQIAAVRQKMMATQDGVAKELKITPSLVRDASTELSGGS
jgi:TRAP-type transport system periplasmic protein